MQMIQSFVYLEDATGSEGKKGGVVSGAGLGEAGDDDEEEDEEVEDGGEVVEAGGALGAGDGEEANDEEDGDGDGVEVAVVGREVVDMDEELVGVLVAESGEVGGPGACHGGAAHHVLQKDVAGCYVGHEIAELHSQVRKRTT